MISGEAGIGKSRLTQEILHMAGKANCTCLTGNCLPGKPLPYLPFIEAIRKDDASDNRSEPLAYSKNPLRSEPVFLQNFVCGDKDGNQIIDVSWSPDRILFTVLDFLKKRSVLRPLILLIEDLQWADSQSIQLLHFLARNARTERILILGTYRTEELIPTDLPTNSMFDTLRLMRREGLVEEIELSGMNPEEINELVGIVLGSNAERKIVEKVMDESEGNPLYAIETTKVLESSDSIIIKDGVWKMVPGKKIEVPPTIREIVLRRFETLSRSQRNVLELASIIGYYFDMEVLITVLNLPPLDLIDDLDRIEERNELIAEIEDGYKFRHHVFQQVIYESISKVKRTELHRRVGEVLEDKQFTGKSMTLAMHFQAANVENKFVKHAICAGEEFAAKGAETEAINYFTKSLDIINRTPELDEYWVRAVSGLGYANNIVGNTDDSKKFLSSLIERVGLERVDPRALRIMAENNLAYGIKEGTLDYLDQAEILAEKDLNEMAEIKADKATLFLWQGNFTEAESNFLQAIESSTPGSNRDLTIRLHCYLGDVYLTQGKIEKALAIMEKATQFAETTPSYYGEMEAYYYSGMTYFHLGDWREAVERIKKSIDIANKIGQLSSNCWSQTNLSLVYDSVGDYRTSLVEARRGLENAMEIQSKYAMLLGLSGMIHANLRNGSAKDALAFFEEAERIEKEIEWSLHSTTRCLFLATKGEYLAAIGDWKGSTKAFSKGFEQMIDTPNGILLEAMARVWYGELLSTRAMQTEAMDQFNRSLILYEGLFNYPQMEKVKWLMGSVMKSN